MNDTLSMEDLLIEAAGGTVEPKPDTTPAPAVEPEPAVVDPAPAVEPTTTPDIVDPATDPTKQTEPKATANKPNPMKEIRDKYTSEKSIREKMDGAIQRFTNGDYSFKLKDFVVDDKMDYDELITAMESADLKAKAESKGLSPEVQAEIERIEKEKIELEKQKLQVSMDRALTNLQLARSLKNEDINNFFKDSMVSNKNPFRWLAQGGDLNDLYALIYRDKLLKSEVDRAVEAAKAKWEEEVRRLNKVPASNPAQPTQPTTGSPSGLSMDALLEEAAKRVR